MKTHKDLDVWKLAMGMVTEVYKESKGFPKEELYGLTNQIRRSAVSVPSNIAEGAARNYKKEFIQFLYISLGSASELETQIMITQNLGYLGAGRFSILINRIDDVKKLMIGLIRYLKGRSEK